jgi:hypothetical protein
MCTLITFVTAITVRIIIISMMPPAVFCRVPVDIADLTCGVHVRRQSAVRTTTSLATILVAVTIASAGAILTVSP